MDVAAVGVDLVMGNWLTLSFKIHRKDNAMVICHALTGSSDVEDWYRFLLVDLYPLLSSNALSLNS